MKSVEKIEKGQKLNFARKGLKGPEVVEVTFLRAIPSEPNRCWCELQGKDFRVAVSKLNPIVEEVPAYIKYGADDDPAIEGDSTLPDNSQETIEKIASTKKVGTSIKKKTSNKVDRKEVKKPIVDSTKDSDVKKLERIVNYFAKNQNAGRKEISEAVNCNINYCGIIRGIVKLYANGMTEKDILSKYGWLTENKMSQVANLFNSNFNGKAK